jgi:uncharacterized membrane protein
MGASINNQQRHSPERPCHVTGTTQSGVHRALRARVWTAWAAPALIAAFLVLGIGLALLRHASFHTNLLDLGYYTQVIWNTAQGHWFATTLKPPNFLADHFSPLLALLVPLFSLAPDARTLLVIEILALASAIVPAYATLRKRYPVLAPLLALAFVLNPMLHLTAQEEFHEIMLAVPLLALAMYALAAEHPRLLYASLLLVMLVREDMAIYVASFGLCLLCCRPRYRRAGAFFITVGVLWFAVVTGVVMPALGSGGYRHARLLAGAGNSPAQAILSLVRDPMQLMRALLTAEKAKALLRTFAPLAGLPLLADGQQLIWAPTLLLLLASPDPVVGTLSGWYVAPLLALLWNSMAILIARLKPRTAAASVIALVVAAVVGFRVWSPFPGGGRFQPALYQITEHTRIGHQVLARIPATDSVAAQSRLGAHLGTRGQLYLFPWYDAEAAPTWFVLDETDPNPYPLSPAELKAELHHLQMDPTLETVWEQDGYFLFKAVPAATFPSQGSKVWPPWLQLEGFELAQTDPEGAFVSGAAAPLGGRTLRVMLYWTALHPIQTNYSISVRLVTEEGRLVAQDDNWPGRGALATSSWSAGHTIRDTHYLQLPPDPWPGPLSLTVLVYETDTVQPLAPPEGYTLATFPTQPPSGSVTTGRGQ